MDLERPKLRPVEVLPAQDDTFCLRDPEGFSDRLVLVPRRVLFLLSLFDGSRSVADIRVEYTRRFGEPVPDEKVREIAGQLDRCLLLDSSRFRQVRDRVTAEFRSSPLRPPSHAGGAYEADPAALGRQLDGWFAAAGARPTAPGAVQPRRPRALIAPHIDPRRGGPAFAAAYAELQGQPPPRTCVVLGISHQPIRRRFALTAKDFATPLGTVPADRDFIGRLAARCGQDFFEDEFAHRGEHSVEFQTVFLRHLYPEPAPLRIVPVLCGSLHDLMPGRGSPQADAEVGGFLRALRETIADDGDGTLLVAGVDFSHVGRRFGQDVELTGSRLAGLEAADRALLRHVLERDAEGFFGAVRASGDATNVCGVPAVYALLHLLGPAPADPAGSRARLLHYGQAVDRENGSVVSFAAAAFDGP